MPLTRETPVPTPVHSSACRIRFGAEATAIERRPSPEPRLALAVPVLAGEPIECLLEAAGPAAEAGGCTVFHQGERTAGFLVAEPQAELEVATREVYRRLFAATAGRHLYRIWNYVPRINAMAAGLENYRRFCRARSLAFEEAFGREFQRHLPAGSAVGTPHGPLALAFVAGAAEPRHVENPQQVPAFEYPPLYGPRPPSFSRATRVGSASDERLFVSGTAAIRGHATVARDDLAAQLACTVENLRLIAAAAGAGEDFGARDHWRRMLKVYLRRAESLGRVQSALSAGFLRPGDAVTYLHADLCRADLLVEIEAVLERDGST